MLFTEVLFRETSYRFKSYTLQAIDYSGEIQPCFLTNRSLYILVWDSRQSPNVIKEWLACLACYVSDSLVMIVASFKNMCNESYDTLLKKMNDFIRSNNALHNKLHFGSWFPPKEGQKGNMGDCWFSFVDIHNPKGKY